MFDIFGLGVVIIKIMTGRIGYVRSAEMPPQKFVELVRKDNFYHFQQIVVSCLNFSIIIITNFS